MSDATVSDLIAASFITAIPPTLMAAGSWWSSRKAKHAAVDAKAEAGAANRAVNNRPAGEPSLYELAVRAVTVAESVDEKVDRVDRKLEHHLGWHQIEDERRMASAAGVDGGGPGEPVGAGRRRGRWGRPVGRRR